MPNSFPKLSSVGFSCVKVPLLYDYGSVGMDDLNDVYLFNNVPLCISRLTILLHTHAIFMKHKQVDLINSDRCGLQVSKSHKHRQFAMVIFSHISERR